MATFAGLFVEIGANIASFVSGMTKMEVLASKTTNKIAREFDQMGSKIGTALAGGAFLYLAKGSIDAMDRLNDLNKSTGISIETLGALGIAAAQSGTDLEGMAAGINKLSVNIGKDAEKFKQLGITAKDPLEALKQLADAYKSIEDPQLRAAVAQEALGKSWQNLAPFLKEGSAGIAEMIEKNKEWASVTTESAKAADEFNDKMAILFKSGALMNSLLAPMLPLLNSLADGLLENAKAAKQTSDEFKPLLEAGKAVTIVVGEFWYVLKTMGKEIGGIAAQLSVLSDAFVKFKMGDFKGAAEPLRQFSSISDAMTADAEAARAAQDAWVESIAALGTSADRSSKSLAEMANDAEVAARTGSKSGDALAKGFLNFDKNAQEAKRKLDEFKKLMDDLFAKENQLDPGFMKAYNMLNEEFAKGMGKSKLSVEAYTKAMNTLAKQQPHYQKTLKAEEEQLEATARAYEENAKAMLELKRIYDDAERSAKEQAAALKFEYEMMGMSNAERARMVAILQLQKAGHDLARQSTHDMADAIARATQAMEDFNRTRSIVDELGSRIADVAVSFVDGWERGVESIRNMMKGLWRELVAFFAKKWVMQIAAGITGSAGLAAQAESFGSNTITGAMGNAFGSWLGGTALGQWATGGSSVGTAFGAGWNAVMGGGDAIGTTAGTYGAAGSVGEFAAQAWQWAAANPYIAAAAIVVIAAVAISRMRSGGPKEGGSFTAMYDARGNLVGPGSALGTDNGRLFTPSSQDSVAREMTQNFAAGFFETLRRMGGSSGAVGFSMGFDTDPRGSAANRVMGQIQRDGAVIWQQLIEAGRDNEDLQRGFSLVMSRMMLAGLQQSNLPHGIARILNTVSAATGTQEDIQAIIALGIAFGDLMNVVTEDFSAGGVIEQANRTAVQLFQEQGDALLDLANDTDMTVEDLQRLTQATAEYRNAAAQLILVYERLRVSINDAMGSMIDTAMLATMSASEQFTFWQTRANELFAQMLASNDPAEIERLFGQFQTAWQNAWNLLSPEEQAAQGSDWAARLRTARTEIDTHLSNLADSIAEDTNDVLTIVGDKMDEAADKFVAASDKQALAADTQLVAAGTPHDVNITITTNDPSLVGNYSGG